MKKFMEKDERNNRPSYQRNLLEKMWYAKSVDVATKLFQQYILLAERDSLSATFFDTFDTWIFAQKNFRSC